MTKAKQRSDEMKRAVALWKKITGVDPGRRSQTIGGWEVVRTFEALDEAIELDSSEITASFLLTHFLNEHMDETKVPLRKVLNGDPGLAARIAAARELYDLLGRPDIAEVRDRFVGAISAAVAHYGAADRDDVKKLLASPDVVGVLRRDALRSIANLKVDQFLSGEPSPEGTRPAYAEVVHQWFNVNSLLAAAARMPPGIALNLIRTPDEFQSFFCFSIRNGGNLFLLSDVPEYSHPFQHQMSRRPDRDMDRRIARNWFPYDLLGVAYDEEAGRLYFKQAEGQALVPYQRHAVPIRKVSELPAQELVWTIMMFDLIKERFWRAGYKAKELSYTAEMLKADKALLDVAKRENLPVAAYEPVRLAPLTVDDVRADAIPDDAVGERGHGVNAWMEERYAHRVPAETLNLIAPPEVQFRLLEDGTMSREVVRDRHRREGVHLEKFGAAGFGTRKSLSDDRLFVARHNLAVQIEKLAKEEFEARKAEVAAWYKAAIEKNATRLIGWAANQELWVCDGEGGAFDGWHDNVGRTRKTSATAREKGRDGREFLYRNLVKHVDVRKDGVRAFDGFYLPEGGFFDQKCFFTGARPSFHYMLLPGTAAELAMFAGCGLEDLPDVLRHFDLRERYSGNSILDRIDPMEWKIENPWIRMDFRVRIALSKRGVAEAGRLRTLPPIDGVATGTPDGTMGVSSIRLG